MLIGKKRISILSILFICIIAVFGTTFAYWVWTATESQYTQLSFSAQLPFTCPISYVDGGGEITGVNVMPSSCTNAKNAIMKEIKVQFDENATVVSGYMNLWLNINNLGTGLSNSENFRYALTTSKNSCVDETLSSGNFKGVKNGDRVKILNNKPITSLANETYYLYIWLDSAETSVSPAKEKSKF